MLAIIRDDRRFTNCSYQYGPDTYLLQVKDATFPARLREYLNVARTTSADFQDCKVRKEYDQRVTISSIKMRQFSLSKMKHFKNFS